MFLISERKDKIIDLGSIECAMIDCHDNCYGNFVSVVLKSGRKEVVFSSDGYRVCEKVVASIGYAIQKYRNMNTSRNLYLQDNTDLPPNPIMWEQESEIAFTDSSGSYRELK